MGNWQSYSEVAATGLTKCLFNILSHFRTPTGRMS